MGLGIKITGCKLGFSLIELLIALAVSGILLAVLSGTMQEITGASMSLDNRAEEAKKRLTLQRLFHRDVQNMTEPESLFFEKESVIFNTSHSTLMDSPYPVKVTWDFSKKRITRIEENELIEYESKAVIATGLSSWNFQAFNATLERWMDFDALKTVTAKSREAVLELSAMKLVLGFGNMNINTVERLPYAVLLLQAQK